MSIGQEITKSPLGRGVFRSGEIEAERDQQYVTISETDSGGLHVMMSHKQAAELRDWLTKVLHPDYGTPNYCHTCSPKGIGYCQCEIACNE